MADGNKCINNEKCFLMDRFGQNERERKREHLKSLRDDGQVSSTEIIRETQ